MEAIQEIRSSKDTARDLLRIWRSYTGEATDVYLMDEMKGFDDLLLRFFRKHFGGDLRGWERFVVFVTASGYLMGRMDSGVSLGWILNKHIVSSIRAGDYHSRFEKKKFEECKQSLDAFFEKDRGDLLTEQLGVAMG